MATLFFLVVIVVTSFKLGSMHMRDKMIKDAVSAYDKLLKEDES